MRLGRDFPWDKQNELYSSKLFTALRAEIRASGGTLKTIWEGAMKEIYDAPLVRFSVDKEKSWIDRCCRIHIHEPMSVLGYNEEAKNWNLQLRKEGGVYHFEAGQLKKMISENKWKRETQICIWGIVPQGDIRNGKVSFVFTSKL